MKRGLVPPGRGQVDPLVRLPSFGASTSRNINPEDDSIYENERQKLLDAMDKAEVVMNRRNFYHDDENEDDPPDHCDRPNWKSKFHPICNNFHEFDMLGAMSQDMFVYRGEATFRAAWTFDSQWVLKTIRFPWMKGLRIAMGLQKEAIILDALSGSPRIIDIYGFCGLNTIAEYMPYEAEDDMVRRFFNPAVKVKEIRESENRIRSLNRLSSLEVLDISIRLAESVADLHGYEGGVIAHGDLNTDQWLKDADGAIKLNDFNNGFIKDWNRQDQRYCTQTHGFVGQFFALESHNSFPNATEQVDIYGFGGSLYTIMTGLYPYWQYDRNDRNERISTGIPVPMESWWRQNNTLDLHLSDLIWWCMDSDFSKRPSIFEVIQELRNLRQMFLEGKLLGRRENDSPSHQVSQSLIMTTFLKVGHSQWRSQYRRLASPTQ
eukprot:Nitzschia sp. Nitz4//scaffold226_size53432//16979//18369//NITZ4_006696-RA/size53432-snap-gene-0.85-mRNA-1//1//CDS//3329542736//6315//frame0